MKKPPTRLPASRAIRGHSGSLARVPKGGQQSRRGAAALALVAAAAALALAACGDGSDATPDGGEPAVTVYVQDAREPVSLAFAPDGRLFYNERTTGRVRVVSAEGELREEPFAEVEVVRLETYSEHGLLGLALDPEFEENGYVYVMYSAPDANGRPLKQLVVRFTDVDGKGEDETVIVDDMRVGPTCCHNGGRLAFGPDGKLYVTIGDTEIEGLAQIATSLAGAILRYNADGTVPEDNPLAGQPAWAWGLRNPFGIAFAEDGTLYATDNGPAGFDEVNLIERARNYGWPEVTGVGDNPRYRNPLYSSEGERVAPTGITVYSGDDLPQYEGQLFFCSYLLETLTRATVEGDSLELHDTGERCLLDVTTGPDGALYFSDLTTVYRWGR